MKKLNTILYHNTRQLASLIGIAADHFDPLSQ